MKNVVGLENAMRLVESACEKGEITIIGEGAMPTPVELLAMCVEFINKQYGVDVLDLLIEKTLRKNCGDCCCDCCCDDDDEDIPIEFDVAKIEDYLESELPKIMPYLTEDSIRDAIYHIVSYCESQNIDGTVGNLSNIIVGDNISEILADVLNNVSYKTCEEVGKKLGFYINEHYVLM